MMWKGLRWCGGEEGRGELGEVAEELAPQFG
jgi:hypothetical protein